MLSATCYTKEVGWGHHHPLCTVMRIDELLSSADSPLVIHLCSLPLMVLILKPEGRDEQGVSVPARACTIPEALALLIHKQLLSVVFAVSGGVGPYTKTKLFAASSWRRTALRPCSRRTTWWPVGTPSTFFTQRT